MGTFTKITVDIDVKRPGRVHPFKKGDVVNLEKWPEIKKAMDRLEKKRAVPTIAPVTKDVPEGQEK